MPGNPSLTERLTKLRRYLATAAHGSDAFAEDIEAIDEARAHIAAQERELEAVRALLLEDIRRENGCDRTICSFPQGPNCICNSDLCARLSRSPGGQEKGENDGE